VCFDDLDVVVVSTSNDLLAEASIAALEEGVPAPVLSSALYSRFASRGLDNFADKALSAMRKGFGGHDEKKS